MYFIIDDNHHLIKTNVTTFYDYKGIHIYKKESNYYVKLGLGYCFLDNSKLKQVDGSLFEIQDDSHYYTIFLYSYDMNFQDNNYSLYEKKDFLLSYNQSSNFITHDPNLKNYYLYYHDNQCKSNYDGFLVNNHSYKGEVIETGDSLDFLGHRIIIEDDFLYINQFLCDIRLSKYKVQEQFVTYHEEEIEPQYILANKESDFQIKKLLPFEEKEKKENSFLKTLLPSMTMSVSSLILSFLNYSAALENQISSTQALSYLLMPFSMSMTGIIFPLIFHCVELKKEKNDYQKRKREYLSYLSSYIDNLKIEIDRYLKQQNCHYYDCSNLFLSLFGIGPAHPDFLKLTLGYRTIDLSFPIEYCKDQDINCQYDSILKITSNQNLIPCSLDLLKYFRISIICRKSDRIYFLYTFLLEISCKHAIEDVNIAIYARDITFTNCFYHLAHLFLDKERLIFQNGDDLLALNQMSLQKPLFLFAMDSIEEVLDNPYVHILSFVNESKKCLKDSDQIVEFFHNDGILYYPEKYRFQYTRKDFNYSALFHSLGKCNHQNKRKKIFHFKDVFYKDLLDMYQNRENGLRATFAYHNEELITLDLHESKQGPHGLIGGTTGSGKSELIISLLLSLCIRYPCDYLNIILIDYKGAGILDSLSYKNKRIPHIVASISNLENDALERLVVAIKNECIHRQQLFQECTKKSNLSIMNLDDYRNNYQKYGLQNITDLLIVVDEFAELKKENPVLIKELISISRIGRSLGLHLLLATQKPAGIIDEQIWSNCKFKLALKVYEEKDSMDLLHCKDALNLKRPGEFELKVENSQIHGQCIYSKFDYVDADPYEVSVLDKNLKKVKQYRKIDTHYESENSVFCKKIINANQMLCLKPMVFSYQTPMSIKRNEFCNTDFIIGIQDDFYRNKKELIHYSICDNLLIVSSRKKEMNAYINTCNQNQRQMIILSNKEIKGGYICDNLSYGEDEDIVFLFQQLIENDFPITLFIEDCSIFLSYNEEYLSLLYKICLRSKFAHFNLVIFSSSASLPIKLINCFVHRFLIESNDLNDVVSLFSMRSSYRAKSFYIEEELMPFIPIEIEEYTLMEKKVSTILRKIPDQIECEMKKEGCLLGYDCKKKVPIYEKGPLLITSYDSSLLNRYKSYGTYFVRCLYTKELISKGYDCILWLGKGAYSQRLFYYGYPKDLNEKEGVFVKEGVTKLIRIIDNA